MGAGETKTLISQIKKLYQLQNTHANIDPQFMINHTIYLQTLRQALQRVNDGHYQIGGIQFIELSNVANFIRDYQNSVEQYFNEFIATPNINNKQQKQTFWRKLAQVIDHKKVLKPQKSSLKQQKPEVKQQKKEQKEQKQQKQKRQEPKKNDNISMLQKSPKMKQIIKKEQLKPIKQQTPKPKQIYQPANIQSKNNITQIISNLQSLLKTDISPQTYKNIISCIEQLIRVRTRINNVEQGNSAFIDNNVNQLQNVSAFLINCSTDVINYHAKYVETTSETNRSKNTLSKKAFWTKAIQVITKAKKQADSQRYQQSQNKLNEQQIKAFKQLSLDIIAGNFKNINGQWFCQNAYTYIKFRDYCIKHKLPSNALEPYIVEFNKIKKLAEQFSNKQNINLVDNLCTYVTDLQKQCKLYKSLFESVKSNLLDSQTKIIKGCFVEQNYCMYENKISYKDTCNILKVVMDDYQQIAQLLNKLAIISGGEDAFYKGNSYAMSLRCTKMVDKIQRELKDAVQQMQSQAGVNSVTGAECSTGSMLKMVKSYINIIGTKLSNNKIQGNNLRPTSNTRILYNSRVDNQDMTEQQKEAVIVSKYLDQILADTKTTIVSQIQPYGNKQWTQWKALFDSTQNAIKQKSFSQFCPVKKVDNHDRPKKQSTQLPQIIIMQVLTQLAKAYGLPNHTSICELLDQIAKQELMVEWINNNYKRQPDSQHQSVVKTQKIVSINNKSNQNRISYSGSGIFSQQPDDKIFQAAIRTNSNISIFNNNTNGDHQNEALNWSINIKQLQANNTKYLEQLNILRDQNRKQKQTINQYELNINKKINSEMQLLSKIKQLEIQITYKDTQITNFNNLMNQNIKKKQDEKTQAVSQLNNKITDLNNDIDITRQAKQNMQSKVIGCLNIIKQQQIITNVGNNNRQPIQFLFTAIVALIQRKNDYKKQKLQLQKIIAELNTKLSEKDNIIEQQQKFNQYHMLIEVQYLKKRKQMQEIEQFVIKAKESSNKLKKKDSECEKLIQKKQQQLSKLNQQIAQKTLRVDELKVQITTMQTKKNEATNLHEESNKLKKQLDTVKLQIKDLNQKLNFTQKEYNIKLSSLTQLTKQVETTDVKLKDMKKQLQGMTKEKQQITNQKEQHKHFIDQASSQRDKLNSEIFKAKKQLNQLRPVVQREMQTLDGIKELKQVKTEYKMQQSSFINQKPQIKSQQKSVIKLQDRLRQSDMKIQELQNIIHNLKIQTKQTVKKNELLEKECHALNVIISGFSSKFRQKESNHKFKQYFGGIISTVQRQALFKQLVELYEPNKIASIKLIFKHPLMSSDSCTQILEGKSRLVFVVRLVSGMAVAMHSEQAVSGVKRVATGKGFIASLTNCRFFAKRKDIQNAPTASLKNGVLSFGADEIRLNLEHSYKLEVNVGFGSKNHSFETRENTGHVLTDNRSCEIDSYEIYELILEV